MVAKNNREKTREEMIPEDEKKKIEKKALEDLKLEKPIDEKVEEDVEEVVKGEIEILKGTEVVEDIEKEVAVEGEAEEEEAVEGEKPAEEEEAKKDEVEKETVVEEKAAAEKVIAPGVTPPGVPAEVPPEVVFWKAKTELGKDVASGVVTNIDEILQSGRKIMEPEIVDNLVPELKSELILIGGRKGKGGGIKRIPVRITATMHRSGRKFKSKAFAAVGDENGLVGIGKASALESRAAINKAISKAKMNVMRIKRGCGSWECGCGGDHSIPYKAEGKSGSVRVVLMPAPRGLGLVADDESKKVLRLAGIKDIWMKTYGNTGMRINLITALFEALKKLYIYER